jgi:hypothetical protein
VRRKGLRFMVDRFTTAPLELPTEEAELSRADLIFYGIDHSKSSFECRIYFDAPDADATSRRDHPGYVDSFFIFGHGGCFGDIGHCNVPTSRDPFDLRPPHQLLPATRIVTVTERIRALIAAGATTTTVTVVAETAGDASNDVLAFDAVRLATYSG